MPKTTDRARASGTGKSVAALKPQLASMRRRKGSAFDTARDGEDATRPHYEGVSLRLREERAARAIIA